MFRPDDRGHSDNPSLNLERGSGQLVWHSGPPGLKDSLWQNILEAQAKIKALEVLLTNSEMGKETFAVPVRITVEFLPIAVLREIFLYFLPMGNPLVLCWICRAWRITAMETSLLWIHPSFVLSTGSCSARPSCAAEIDDRYPGCYRSLHLAVTQDQLSVLFDERLQFSNLQSCSLHFGLLDLDAWLWHQGLRHSAPCLQILAISAETVSSDASTFSGFIMCFPWSQLTILHMQNTLLECSILQIGSFAVQPNGSRINFRPSIILSQLFSLRVKFQNQLHFRSTVTEVFDPVVLNTLTFPSLKALHLTARVDWSDPYPMVGWIRRQPAALSTLTLECKPVFRAVQEHLLWHLRVLTIISAAATYVSPGWARFSTLDGLVFDLTETITTWVTLEPRPERELRLFADGEVLSGIKSRLLAFDNGLVIAAHVSDCPSVHRDQSQRSLEHPGTCLRIRRKVGTRDAINLM
ncbi:hypothetical protein B0H16DRAFT_1478322 [Mycena metata]|uniref:F-box domain-containing protein n=1 Tax=Mycena metata TaxID=1033252 RepID=A0AAD7H6Z2_9AGAR|nr:hypothetical protein B0H16DRAFT_1478322 [Mycena metata]